MSIEANKNGQTQEVNQGTPKVEKVDIVRGKPIEVIDLLGNVFSLPQKILLFSDKIDNHMISKDVEEVVYEFINYYQLNDVKVRLNQYCPHDELRRLFNIKHTHFLIRFSLGIVAWISYLVSPNRLVGGDFYNPFTNSVNIFSDHVAIALHELGHALDFKRRKYPGLYALTRYIPFVALYQEFMASKYAVKYLQKTNRDLDEISAYKILYPAYSTYVFGAVYDMLPTPILINFYLPFIALGHLLGRLHSARRKRELGIVLPPPPPPPPPKVLLIKFFFMLGGFLIGRLVWGLWGGIIAAILSYYTYKEVREYLTDKKQAADDKNPTTEAENLWSPLPKPEQILSIKKGLLDYKKLFAQHNNIFHIKTTTDINKLLSQVSLLCDKTLRYIETKNNTLADGEYKKLRNLLDYNSKLIEIKTFSQLCIKHNLLALYSQQRHCELGRLSNRLWRGANNNSLIWILIKHSDTILKKAKIKYDKAKNALDNHDPRKAYLLSSKALEKVSDDENILEITKLAKSKIVEAFKKLKKADQSYSNKHYLRAIRYAKRANKIDVRLEQRAVKIEKYAREQRKIWLKKTAIVTVCTVAGLCIITLPAIYGYEYIQARFQFQHIAQMPSTKETVNNKIAQLRNFIAKYHSLSFTKDANTELKKLIRTREYYDFTKLEADISASENMQKYPSDIKMLKQFLVRYPGTDKKTLITNQIDQFKRKDDRKQYMMIQQLANNITSNKNINQLIYLCSNYDADHPNGMFKTSVNEKMKQAIKLLNNIKYDDVLNHYYKNIAQRIGAYRDFIELNEGSDAADKIHNELTTYLIQYYKMTVAKIELLETKNRFDDGILCCEKFGADVKYGKYVDLINKEKYHLVCRKNDFVAFEQMMREEKEFGQDYQKAKEMYSSYLESNPKSFEGPSIKRRIVILNRMIVQKTELAKIMEGMQKNPGKISFHISQLDTFLEKDPEKPFKSSAVLLLNKLKYNQNVEIKKLNAERKREAEIHDEKLWKRIYRYVIQGSGRYSDKMKTLEHYVKTHVSNTRHIAEAKRLIESLRFPANEEKRIECGLKAAGNRFALNGDGTVTDNKTGRMWTVDDSFVDLRGGDLTFRAAKMYVHELRVGGYSDWRMPTPDELASLYKERPCFPETGAKWYWSSNDGFQDNMVEVVTVPFEKHWEHARVGEYAYGSVRAVRP